MSFLVGQPEHFNISGWSQNKGATTFQHVEHLNISALSRNGGAQTIQHFNFSELSQNEDSVKFQDVKTSQRF